MYIYIYTMLSFCSSVIGLKVNLSQYRDKGLYCIIGDSPALSPMPHSWSSFHLSLPAPSKFGSGVFGSREAVFEKRTTFHKVWSTVIRGGESKSIVGFSKFGSGFFWVTRGVFWGKDDIPWSLIKGSRGWRIWIHYPFLRTSKSIFLSEVSAISATNNAYERRACPS